ncbi:PEBP-like protein [Pleurotus pulmonarius]
MMFSTFASKTLLPVALASFAAALSGTSNTNPPSYVSGEVLKLQAIQAHFKNAGIVPDGLPTFDPKAELVANYAGVGETSPGQSLTRAQVASAPTFTVTPGSGSLSGTYTLAMVDFGPVGSDQSKGVTRHWLVNGLTITNSAFSNTSAVAITQYAGPAPPAGSGPHRYAFLLWEQPSTFTAPSAFSQPNMGVSTFDVNAYATDAKLGAVIAGNYITVEEGTATVTPSPTAAVETSTLPAASVPTISIRASATPLGSGNGAHALSAQGAGTYGLLAFGAIVFAVFA